MSARALIIGGTGQIGTATAKGLVAAGFDVVRGSRRGAGPSIEGVIDLALDREDTPSLHAAATGSDLVVDAVAFTSDHATQLAGLRSRIGSLVVISTGSVYLGDNGLSFDDSVDGESYPLFPVPIRETQPVIESLRESYGARKAALERRLLAIPDLPVSILRPGSVHGPFSPKLREWFFLKRALDGRGSVVLARGGRQRFATSATANIAALVVACAAHPATRVLNAVDEESLTMSEIAVLAGEIAGSALDVVAFEGPPRDGVGRTPWDAPIDFVCSMAEARERIGYRPVVDYPTALAEDLAWILSARAGLEGGGEGPESLFPASASWFDYEAEDRLLREGGDA